VTTTADAGAGSFRQVLTDANANVDQDTIVFNIPGAGPHRIQPLTILPKISNSLIIDGYSQPGSLAATAAAAATIQIELDGSILSAADGTQYTLDTAPTCQTASTASSPTRTAANTAAPTRPTETSSTPTGAPASI